MHSCSPPRQIQDYDDLITAAKEKEERWIGILT